jgi:hypothetical protein
MWPYFGRRKTARASMPASRLNQVTTGSDGGSRDGDGDVPEMPTESAALDLARRERRRRAGSWTLTLQLGVHDERFSKEDVLVGGASVFAPDTVAAGDRVHIQVIEPESPRSVFRASESADPQHRSSSRPRPPADERPWALTGVARLPDKSRGGSSYVFAFPPANPSIISRHPALEVSPRPVVPPSRSPANTAKVSVSAAIASALGFKNRTQVVMSSVGNSRSTPRACVLTSGRPKKTCIWRHTWR